MTLEMINIYLAKDLWINPDFLSLLYKLRSLMDVILDTYMQGFFSLNKLRQMDIVLKLYEQGNSTREVAEILQIKQHQVARLLKSNTLWKPRTREEAAKLYLEKRSKVTG